MSTKFEQLLDYLVNEEMEKANELFHEIVVEKSREIYENLISDELAEEEEEDNEEQQDESMESDDEEQQDESIEEMDLEDSYMTDEADEDEEDDMSGDMMGPDDATDDLLGDVEVDDEAEDQAIMDIKDAIAELEAAFADLQASQNGDDNSMDMGDEESDDEENMEMMGMVREYRETVAKPSGDVAGANTGDKMGSAGATKSPVSSAKGKPTSEANAGNIVGKSDTANEDGTTPNSKVGGLVKQGGSFVGANTQNVGTTKSGTKTLSKVAQKSEAEGHAAGAGTGENSVKGTTNTKSVV